MLCVCVCVSVCVQRYVQARSREASCDEGNRETAGPVLPAFTVCMEHNSITSVLLLHGMKNSASECV